MKSFVGRVAQICEVAGLVILLTIGSFPQVTECSCPDPPGGSVKCEGGLLPVCVIANGQKTSLCVQPPKANADPKHFEKEMEARILSAVLKTELTVQDIGQDKYSRILGSGGVVILSSTASPFGQRVRNQIQFSYPGKPTAEFNLPIFDSTQIAMPSNRFVITGPITLANQEVKNPSLQDR